MLGVLPFSYLAEVFDQHEIEVEFVALRVENGALVGGDG